MNEQPKESKTESLCLHPKAKDALILQQPPTPARRSVPCTCKVKFLSVTPAGLAATQVKTPESASCTWEILNPPEKGGGEKGGGVSTEMVPFFSCLPVAYLPETQLRNSHLNGPGLCLTPFPGSLVPPEKSCRLSGPCGLF